MRFLARAPYGIREPAASPDQAVLRRIRKGIYLGSAALFLGTTMLAPSIAQGQSAAVIAPVRTGVTNDDVAAMPGVRFVYKRQGRCPNVIIIAQQHAHEVGALAISSGADAMQTSMNSIEKICNRLYDKYGVTALMMEGVPPAGESVYAQTGRLTIRIPEDASKYDIQYFGWMERVLNGRKWTLRSGELGGLSQKRQQQADIDAVYAAFAQRIKEIAAQAYQITGTLKGNMFYPPTKEAFSSAFLPLYQKELAAATSKLESILTPQRMRQLYRQSVTEREEKYLEQCGKLVEEGKGPVIIVIGSSHLKTLSESVGRSFNFIALSR